MTDDDLRAVLKEANHIADIGRAIHYLKTMLCDKGFCSASTFDVWADNYQADRGSLVAEAMLLEQALNSEQDESPDACWVD